MYILEGIGPRRLSIIKKQADLIPRTNDTKSAISRSWEVTQRASTLIERKLNQVLLVIRFIQKIK